MKQLGITGKEEIISFMKSYNFARIITNTTYSSSATSLPFLVKEREGDIYLYSRFGKANRQWKEVITRDVLIIFSGQDATTGKVNEQKNSSSLRYEEVHVYGTGEIITDKDEYQLELEQIIVSFEKEYKMQWDCLPATYREKMLNTIIPFKIKVTDIHTEEKQISDRAQH